MSSSKNSDNDNSDGKGNAYTQVAGGVQLRTLAPGSHTSEYEIKKSRFLGYAKSVKDWKEAQQYISHVRQEHPKARHWCYGYYNCMTGNSNVEEERCSDDGEPTGTAGLPILGALKSEGISNAVCVVVRYFGGIKLGAGGLIRAYGAAARQVLREAPTITLIPTSSFRIHVPSSSLAGAVYESIHKIPGTTTLDEEYQDDGSFQSMVMCPTDQLERLQSILLDATRGNAVFQSSDN